MSGSSTPTRCVEDTPIRGRTIYLAGVAINLAELQIATQIDYIYLSRILRGTRTPSVYLYLSIARELGMGLESLLEAINDRSIDIESRRITS